MSFLKNFKKTLKNHNQTDTQHNQHVLTVFFLEDTNPLETNLETINISHDMIRKVTYPNKPNMVHKAFFGKDFMKPNRICKNRKWFAKIMLYANFWSDKPTSCLSTPILGFFSMERDLNKYLKK